MGTNYIAPIWRMPRNANKDKLSNYSLEFGPTTIDVISTNTTWQTDTGLDNAKKVSFSVWVNPNSGTGSSKMNIVSQAYGTWDGNFNIAYTADTTTLSLDFRANNNAFINSSTLLAGDTWHHICFVIDLTLGGTIAQEVRCFVNNSEVVNQSSINPPLNFVLQLRSFNIGRRLRGPNAGSSNQWQGKIAQACFFNYALTDGTNGTTNQIEYLYNLNNPMAITGAKPVAYWPLGDNSNPNATAGYPNISVAADSVFNFNGSNNFIELNSVQNLTGEFSISIWVKPAAFNSNQIILGNDAFDWIRLLTANQITFRINGGSGSTDENFDAVAGESLVPNVWQHLFFYRDSSNNIRVYRNGSLFSDDINTNSDTFKIGKIGSRTGVYYTGEISNVAIWKSDQSSEISNIYNSGVPATTYTNTPTAWYKLNQSANWEADTVGDWQIPDAVSSYPQSFNFDGNDDFVSTNFNVDNYTNLFEVFFQSAHILSSPDP